MSQEATKFGGTNADPDFRRERARRAGVAAQSVDTYVRGLIRRQHLLTVEHARQLRELADAVVTA